MRTEQKAAKNLLSHKKTIAIAESCTGGLLAHTLTNVPGASAFLMLGIIAYDNKAKTQLLKIPASLIKKNGAVSAPVAERMAAHARKILNTDIGIGITGIAGPGGGSTLKPVGLVFIGLSTRQGHAVYAYRFRGSRLMIKKQAVNKALDLLLKASLEK